MTAVVRADALRLPLRDNSVDLIVTSPPYFALRSYQDGGEHYDGQLGSEPTPQAFLEALWAVTAECWRVLKPSGSMFMNLGDKRSGSGGPSSYNQAAFGRAKSKMLLPHRYAIGCEDGLADPEGIGWIVRQDLVWSKPNGLPESVKDRTRDAHEYWFHMTKQGDYFAAMDELRDPYKPDTLVKCEAGGYDATFGAHDAHPSNEHTGPGRKGEAHAAEWRGNPLGALPRSVWGIATEPLKVPDHLGIDHFAAFPSEWPCRLILGFSPSGICTVCNEARRPVVDAELVGGTPFAGRDYKRLANGSTGGPERPRPGGTNVATISGYVCACTPYTDHPERRRPTTTPGRERRQDQAARAEQGEPGHHGDDWPKRQPVREYHLDEWTPAPSRPAVVLDPFGGTGTTAMVARALGRTGISLDLSADYCRLASWRIFESGHGAKAIARTNRERQGVLL